MADLASGCKVDDDQVVLSICFCDENCSAYNMLKEHEGAAKGHEGAAKEPLKPSKKGRRNSEFQKRLHNVKRKIVDCRQVRIPASINVLSDNPNSKRFTNGIHGRNNCVKGEPDKVVRANGMQEPNLLPSTRPGRSQRQASTDLSGGLLSPDMIVSVSGTEFKCSSALLKKYSGFFRDLEIDSSCKIYLCGICINVETFSAVYTWMQMYVREPARIVNENNVVDLLSAGLFLMMSELELTCWQMICDQSLYSGEKAFKIFKRSIDKTFYQITETVLDRVLKYFPVLINTNTFLLSNLDHILPVLLADEIVCNSEMEVFLAVSKWILHDLDDRWKHLPELMDAVRFGLMSSEQLCCLNLSDVPQNVRMIAAHPHTSKRIENGIVLNSIKAEFNYPEESSQGFWFKCRELGVEVPKNRTPSDFHLQICVCHNKNP